MKLITSELQARFLEIGEQREESDPIIVAKFFNPCGSQTWWAISYDPEYNICFGYVTGMFVDELGSFSIDEMEALRLPFGLRIERDIHFDECRLSDVKSGKVM
ncbi:MAG: DUF2958 domain-containing protein [Bacteroidetes bacterium]|nr:MAG: DUF2958 domain-containing protein [Bacteroidota bacterium]